MTDPVCDFPLYFCVEKEVTLFAQFSLHSCFFFLPSSFCTWKKHCQKKTPLIHISTPTQFYMLFCLLQETPRMGRNYDAPSWGTTRLLFCSAFYCPFCSTGGCEGIKETEATCTYLGNVSWIEIWEEWHRELPWLLQLVTYISQYAYRISNTLQRSRSWEKECQLNESKTECACFSV